MAQNKKSSDASAAPAPTGTASAVPAKPGTPTMIWKDLPDAHDYPAAASYLRLLGTAKQAAKMANALKKAPVELHPAKDVLRAAHLDLLPLDNPAVQSDLAKVKAGQQLSPVLIVRGDIALGIRAIIADGYHRVCASYHLSENEPIPCRLIDYPGKR